MADSIVANKIHFYNVNDSDDLYGILRSMSGQVRDVANEAWDAWPGAAAPLIDHDISLGNPSGYLWIGGFPDLANAFYLYEIKRKAGANPNTDDMVVGAVKSFWDGNEFGDIGYADKLMAAASTIVKGTVSWDNTNATTEIIYCRDITEATADHYKDRVIIFTSGDLFKQATDILNYALDAGEGKFTVTALTEAPGDNDTFVIV